MSTTGDRFLRGLKRRISNPSNQILIDDSGMFEIADDVIRDRIVPMLIGVNQNFFVIPDEIALVTNQNTYSIPYRSIGRSLRDLKIAITGQDDSTSDLSLIDLEDEHLFTTDGVPQGFYFRGDKFVIVRSPTDDSRYLKVWYDLQPSRIIKTSDAAQITAIAGDVLTCTSIPTTIITGTTVDIIQGRAGCSMLAMDIVTTNVSGTQITFATDDVPDDLSVGDYISVAQTSPVLMLPDEVQPLVESLAGARILYAVGDFDGSDRLRQEAAEQEKNILKLLTPRIVGEQTKIVNRRGLLRGRGYNAWRLRSGFGV